MLKILRALRARSYTVKHTSELAPGRRLGPVSDTASAGPSAAGQATAIVLQKHQRARQARGGRARVRTSDSKRRHCRYAPATPRRGRSRRCQRSVGLCVGRSLPLPPAHSAAVAASCAKSALSIVATQSAGCTPAPALLATDGGHGSPLARVGLARATHTGIVVTAKCSAAHNTAAGCVPRQHEAEQWCGGESAAAA